MLGMLALMVVVVVVDVMMDHLAQGFCVSDGLIQAIVALGLDGKVVGGHAGL